MVQAVIQLGGNLPGTFEKMGAFSAWITAQRCQVVHQSKIYQTTPWGMTGVPDFLNQIMLVNTPDAPEKFLGLLLSYEKICGRERSAESGYVSRIIDVDLLLHGSTIMQSPCLTLPHPRMHLRRFILLPLAEVEPHLIHPVLKKTMQDLLLACPDKGEVHIFDHG